MAIPKAWKKFIDSFGDNDPYWFFPKRSVGNDRLPDIVAIYAEFDGKNFDQDAILDRLSTVGLTEGQTTAQIRVLRKALENLGLCWLDNGTLRMTPSSRDYIADINRINVIENHLWRYYLTNPINSSTSGLTLFPHRFLIEILLMVGNELSHDEYSLFVARACSDKELKKVSQAILNWRKLSNVQRISIKNALPDRYHTIDDDATYSMAFHRLASYFEKDYKIEGKDGLKLKKGNRSRLLKIIADHRKAAIPIAYKSIADCVADYGDIEQVSNIEDKLDYHIERSEPGLAVEAFKELPISMRRGMTVKKFREEIFLEKHLEDYLFTNHNLIEHGLTNVRRQETIESGIIDLIADDKNKNILVIELKKTRASDKVFGQLARYMGCLKEKYAKPGQKVRGYIIGSEISEKLRYAIQVAPKGNVRLKRFRRDPNNADIFVED